MANMLVKDIPAELLAKVNYAAKIEGKNQGEFVINTLEKAVSDGSGKAVRTEREANVFAVRGGIQDKKRGRKANDRARTVRRSRDRASADSGAVDGSIQQNPESSVLDRKVSVPHSDDCNCPRCLAVEGDF